MDLKEMGNMRNWAGSGQGLLERIIKFKEIKCKNNNKNSREDPKGKNK